MDLGITKKEKATIEKRGYKFTGKEATAGMPINSVIMVVHNPSRPHDSGYPFICAFGAKIGTQELYSMGWHDHYITNIPVNTDTLGKNIFRVFHWGLTPEWKIKAWGAVKGKLIWVSSLELDKDGGWR